MQGISDRPPQGQGDGLELGGGFEDHGISAPGARPPAAPTVAVRGEPASGLSEGVEDGHDLTQRAAEPRELASRRLCTGTRGPR